MSDRKEFKNNNIYNLYFIGYIAILLLLLVYRLVIIIKYSSQYIDEDQALLWTGVSKLLKHQMLEPHFEGQNYGTMFESVLGYFFVKLGVPINYALPIGTTLLAIIPFVICSLPLLLKNRVVGAYIILSLGFIFGWQFDLLTTMPRSFIPGFAFAVAGAIIFYYSRERYIYISISVVFYVIGFIFTESTISIILISVLSYVLIKKPTKKAYLYMGINFLIGSIFVLYFDFIFYKLYPEYCIYFFENNFFNIKVLLQNISNMKNVFSAFSMVNICSVPICFLIIQIFIIGVIVKYKDLSFAILYCCSIGGVLLFFAYSRSLIHWGNLYYSQTRVFLFIAYLFLLMSFYIFDNYCFVVNSLIKGRIICFIIIIFIFLFKLAYFNLKVLDEESLYQDDVFTIERVDTLKDQSKAICELVNDSNVDLIIFNNNKVLAYTCDYYINIYCNNTPITYVSCLERRTDVYKYLKDHLIDGNIVNINSNDDGIGYEFYQVERFNALSQLYENNVSRSNLIFNIYELNEGYTWHATILDLF